MSQTDRQENEIRRRRNLVYWRTTAMLRRLTILSVVVFLAAPAVARAQNDRGKSKEQVEFGIKVAQNGLWNEALYRWEKATQLDPTYA